MEGRRSYVNLGSIQGQREAFSLGVVALTSQLFHLLYVDHPETLNAGWISALAAGLPALLLCLCLRVIAKGQKDAPACQIKCAGGRIFCAVLCLASLFDLGCSTRLFADTAKYTALDSMTLPALILPLLLVLAAACVRGGMAISGAARVWLCVLGLLFLVLLLTLFPRFNPRWLFPVLGPGAPALIRPIPSLLGALTGIVPLWLITHPDKAPLKRWNLATLCAVVCVMVACAVALCAMLLPAMLDVPLTRHFQYDRFMTNGRVPSPLQFILITIWYGSMMIQLAFFLLCASAMLCLALPRVRYRLAVCLCALAALPLACFPIAAPATLEWASLIRLALILPPILALTLVSAIRNQKKRRTDR